LNGLQYGYLSFYPDTTHPSTPIPADSTVSNLYDMNSYNYITSTCYINLEPGWLDLTYYIPNNTAVIPNIPRGYKMNQFTINPAGELASSLEFVYTKKWAWVYTIVRTSDNTIVTDEVDLLDKDLVLFELSNKSIVDESDAFFGEGNNGRDCIQKRDSYDYDLLSCFFQNDQKGYSPSQYLSGLVQTTGIARFINKFNFAVIEHPGTPETIGSSPWSFTLEPKKDADFSFYVQMDGFICPKLISRVGSTSSCNFTFFYKNTEAVTITGSKINKLVTFNQLTNIASVSVPVSTEDYTLSVGVPTRDCLVLTCVYNTETTIVTLQTPNVQIVSADEQNLVAKVYYAIDNTIESTINDMNQVRKTVLEVNKNISEIISQLKQLDFNVTKFAPYEDFSALRAQVDAKIESLGGPSSGMSPYDGCESPWESADCFFEQFGTTLITIAIIVVVAIAGYLICIKGGVAQKIAKAFKKK